MFDPVNEYTSTGIKLLYHAEVIKRFKEARQPTPISLQVGPTSRCNLNCSFCSNANRSKHEALDDLELAEFIQSLQKLGLKTVEWTGGGDPTMYEPINDIIVFCKSIGLQQGFITNGVALSNLSADSLGALTWLRISMNCLDYVGDIEIPPEAYKIPGLGFSYVINDDSTQESIKKLKLYSKRYMPDYIRVVPNCQATDEEQERHNRQYAEAVDKLGPPFFYQAKVFSRPQRCWWGWFKPFLLHDGYVYPCSSVVLNMDAERKFHEKYRWFPMREYLSRLRLPPAVPFENDSCNHCVFKAQNDMVDSLIYPGAMRNFV